MHEAAKALNARWRDCFMLDAQTVRTIAAKHDELPLLGKATRLCGVPSVSYAAQTVWWAELCKVEATHSQVCSRTLQNAVCLQHVLNCRRVVVLLQLNNVNMNGNNRDCGIQELTKQ